MGKLEERMLNNVKNKRTRKPSGGMRFMNVVSISYLFITPMLIMFFICKYFVKNQEIFLTLMSLSFFCGVYSVIRELSKLYNRKIELDKKGGGSGEYF